MNPSAFSPHPSGWLFCGSLRELTLQLCSQSKAQTHRSSIMAPVKREGKLKKHVEACCLRLPVWEKENPVIFQPTPPVCWCEIAVDIFRVEKRYPYHPSPSIQGYLHFCLFFYGKGGCSGLGNSIFTHGFFYPNC